MASFTGKPETQIVSSKRELERVNKKRSKILAKILEAKKLLTVRILYLKSVFAAIFADLDVSRLHEPQCWLSFNGFTIPLSMLGDSFAVRTGFQSSADQSELLQKLPVMFVSAFFGLEAEQPFTIDFQQVNRYGMAVPCFSHCRTTSSLVHKIIQAIYPTLRNKKFVYISDEKTSDQLTISTKKVTTTFSWYLSAEIRQGAEYAQLVMDWNCTYDEFGTGQRKDSFTFRAFAMGAHNLLGGRSQIKTFNADILHTVAKIVIKNL